ncbi:MAG: hypothetical protein M1553_14620 [Firmicutes bacterium]|nr:hypothetical protein [Bacillota bacterium]
MPQDLPPFWIIEGQKTNLPSLGQGARKIHHLAVNEGRQSRPSQPSPQAFGYLPCRHPFRVFFLLAVGKTNLDS